MIICTENLIYKDFTLTEEATATILLLIFLQQEFLLRGRRVGGREAIMASFPNLACSL